MKKNGTAALEAKIKRRLKAHFKSLGLRKNKKGELYPPSRSKATLRRLHAAKRMEILNSQNRLVKSAWPRLKQHFADGTDVSAASISPKLELVSAGTWQAELFRLAALGWSIPVSDGYGRRLRYLVWDNSNKKLIGLIGLCDPVFNLRVRDELVGWNVEERRLRLVNTMSAYVLGAVPPYSMLLGGKLVACLVRSRKIRDDFARKYGESFGMILEKRRASALVLVTVTSALGRSSVYNRLSLNGARYFRSLGFTGGWGHFHIPSDLFELIRDYLEARGDEYGHNNRFGEGPNWRLRATRRALELMGLDPGLLRHGIRREVFACELASNAKEYLRGEDETPDYRGLLSVPKVGELARKRWMEKRAESHSDYRAWRKESYLKLIEPSGSRDGRRRHVPREF